MQRCALSGPSSRSRSRLSGRTPQVLGHRRPAVASMTSVAIDDVESATAEGLGPS